jgi:hypothetical protein
MNEEARGILDERDFPLQERIQEVLGRKNVMVTREFRVVFVLPPWSREDWDRVYAYEYDYRPELFVAYRDCATITLPGLHAVGMYVAPTRLYVFWPTDEVAR